MSASSTSFLKSESIEKWPCAWSAVLPHWLGGSSFRFPVEISKSRSFVGLISSHMKRDRFMQPDWEKSLEAALAFAKNSNALPLFAAETPYSERLRHACRRFSIPHVELCVSSNIASHESSTASIEMSFSGESDGCDSEFADIRICDRAVSILSHTLFALHVRSGGAMERLIRARLNEPLVPLGSTIIAFPSGASGRIKPVEERLADLGAVLWISNLRNNVESHLQSNSLRPWGCDHRAVPSTTMPWMHAPQSLLHSEKYFVHCTRARQGPWPEQSQAVYFDEAIRLVWRPSWSPIEALARILSQQRLVATQRLRRGQLATVCFSGRTLSDLLAMRSYQSHIARWDWEPYGIAIRRELLEQKGARPVTYLPRAEIERLPKEQLPFAQPTPHREGGRDWRVENEWRLAQDLRLHTIQSEDAFVFVPSAPEAKMIAPLSRWPIVVTP